VCSSDLGADLAEIDWEKGFNVYEENELDPPVHNQGSSSSCVAQATAEHYRVWVKKCKGNDLDFSRHFVYAHINLGPDNGAYLRDGVAFGSSVGICSESLFSSYENGNPPSERFMISQEGLTPAHFQDARLFEDFNYRLIPGNTYDIQIFSHAIQNNCGVIGGFHGSNPGWTQNVVRPPKPGEARWGHSVFLSGYGMYNGKKCLFTRNSWGGAYTIKEGRWKGYQAIPEDYFLASVTSAAGPSMGAFVYNSWVLVPDESLKPNVKLMDFLKKNEGKIVQDVEGTGGFALVKGGKLLVASKARVAELVAAYIVKKEGVATPKSIWDAATKEQF